MSAPQAVLEAIARVSGTVPCLECGSTVSVEYSELLDAPVIRHPVRHSFGLAADALAAWVTDELARHVSLAQYGEPEPLNVWAVTA